MTINVMTFVKCYLFCHLFFNRKQCLKCLCCQNCWKEIHYKNMHLQSPATEIFFSEERNENFVGKFVLIYSLKTYTCRSTSNHNLCFGSKIRKL